MLAIVATVAAHPQLPLDARIKHVVVVYQENRAFDHLFGWDKTLNVSGLNGTESNPIDPEDPSKGSVTVSDGAPYVDDDLTGLDCDDQRRAD